MHRLCAALTVLLSLSNAANAADTVLADDIRLDYRSKKGKNLTYAGDDPVVFCDSAGNHTIVWNALCSFDAPDYDMGLRGRAFDSLGTPITETRALFGSWTDYTCGSETGAFATATYVDYWNSRDVKRYELHLAPIDTEPFRDQSEWYTDVGYGVHSMHMAMDRGRHLAIATSESNDEHGPYRSVWVRLYEDTTLLDQWERIGSLNMGSYTSHALCFLGTARLEAFFAHQQWDGAMSELTRISSRVFETGGDALDPVGLFFQKIAELDMGSAIEQEWPIKVAAIERWRGAVGVYNDTAGLTLARFDSLGRIESTYLFDSLAIPTANPTTHDRFEVCASLKGGYATGHYGPTTTDIKWGITRTADPVHHDRIPYRADDMGIAMDGLHNRYLAWSQDGVVFYTRFGAPAIPPVRVSGDGADPRTAATLLLPGGELVASSWSVGSDDSLVTVVQDARSSIPVGSFKTSALPYPGMPRLANVGTDVAVLYRSVSGGDTVLTLSLWDTSRKDTSYTRTVTTGSSAPGRGVLAVNGGNILVVWEDYRAGAADSTDLYCQLFDVNGTPIAGNRKLADGAGPRITATGAGGFAVSYTLVRTRTAGEPIPIVQFMTDVYVLETNSGGGISVPPTLLNTVANGASATDICAMDSTLFVTWHDSNDSAAVMGRMIHRGTPRGAPFAIADVAEMVGRPRAVATGDSSALAAWFDRTDGLVHSVHLDFEGRRVGDEEIVSNDSADADVEPSLSVSSQADSVFYSWVTGPRPGWSFRRLLGELVLTDISAHSGTRQSPQAALSLPSSPLTVRATAKQVTLGFSTATAGVVSATLFRADGRVVRELFSDWMEAGDHHRTAPTATMSTGKATAPGVYLIRVRHGRGESVVAVLIEP